MKLRIYKSFEEAAQAEAQNAARQPPKERMKEAVELILRVYGVTQKQLNNRKGKLHIKIISYT